MVLQQLSGTTLPSAGADEMYTLIIQSCELLLPQHMNWSQKNKAEDSFHDARKTRIPRLFIMTGQLFFFQGRIGLFG